MQNLNNTFFGIRNNSIHGTVTAATKDKFNFTRMNSNDASEKVSPIRDIANSTLLRKWQMVYKNAMQEKLDEHFLRRPDKWTGKQVYSDFDKMNQAL